MNRVQWMVSMCIADGNVNSSCLARIGNNMIKPMATIKKKRIMAIPQGCDRFVRSLCVPRVWLSTACDWCGCSVVTSQQRYLAQSSWAWRAARPCSSIVHELSPRTSTGPLAPSTRDSVSHCNHDSRRQTLGIASPPPWCLSLPASRTNGTVRPQESSRNAATHCRPTRFECPATIRRNALHLKVSMDLRVLWCSLYKIVKLNLTLVENRELRGQSCQIRIKRRNGNLTGPIALLLKGDSLQPECAVPAQVANAWEFLSHFLGGTWIVQGSKQPRALVNASVGRAFESHLRAE